jgi:anti-sigma factor ChrR (cupin superfamily)
MDLAAIPWRKTRHPGVGIHFYASDERTGRVVALIRMEPGRGYPGHRHRGAEDVLVVQGGYRDTAGEHRQGDFVHYDAGTSHSPAALGGQGDPACVLLAVAHEGILPLDD